MRNIDLISILKDTTDGNQGVFKPQDYRLALIILDPTQDSLENWFRELIRCNLAYTDGIMSLTAPAALNQMLGKEGTSIRNAIQSALKVQNSLGKSGNPVAESLIGTRDYLADFIEEEAIRYLSEIVEFKDITNRRLIALPDRLAKLRSLAEESLVKSYLDPNDRTEWLDDAINRLEEVVEQPVGSKDPFNWLLFAWAKLQKGDIGGDVHDALSQACLASSANQDAVFNESHRALANYLTTKKRYDKAASAVQKVLISDQSNESRLEFVSYCASGSNPKNAVGEFKQLLKDCPLASFLPISNANMAQNGGAWMEVVREVEKELVASAGKELNAWKLTLDAVSAISENHPSIQELLPKFVSSYDTFAEQQIGAHLFEAAYLSKEAIRLNSELLKSAKTALRQDVARADQEIQALEAKKQSMRRSRDESVAMLRGQKILREGNDRILLNLNSDNSAQLQNGCGSSLLVGISGFGAYFLLVMMFGQFSAFAGPSSNLGKFIMGGLLIPPILGGIMTIVDSLRRASANHEFNRRSHGYEADIEAKISELDAQFDSVVSEMQIDFDSWSDQLKNANASLKALNENDRQQHQAA